MNDDISEITNPFDIQFGDDFLMMNSDMLKGSMFIFIVACVCHEMIHEYARFFGDYRQLVFDNKDDIDNMESHMSYTFQSMLKRANKMRLNVIDTIKNPDPILNMNAYNVLVNGKPMYESNFKSKREELEKTGSVRIGDMTLYDYGRKAVIAHFD